MPREIGRGYCSLDMASASLPGLLLFMGCIMTYAEKLKDPRWQKKRLEILDDRGWACEWCCDKEKTLHVHHVLYLKNLNPWEYDNKYLRVLCETCHVVEHTDDAVTLSVGFLQRYFGYTKEELSFFLFEGIKKFSQ